MKRKQEMQEVRGSDARDLRVKLHELRKEVFNLRFRGSAEEVAKTSRYREVRRTVARILTDLAQRDKAQTAGGKQ